MTMTMHKSIVAVILIVIFFSCKKRDRSSLIPFAPPEDGEVITTVKLVFTDSATGSSRGFFFADADGPGGKAAVYGPGDGTQSDSVIVLEADAIYYVRLLFLNESIVPADTVSKEVEEEGDEHIVYYDNGSPLPLSSLRQASVTLAGGTGIRYADEDSGYNSIGLLTRWKTGSGTHQLRITLKHQHEGKSMNVKDGETELEVFFRLSS